MKDKKRFLQYCLGYISCVLLTMFAYLIANLNYYHNWAIISGIGLLAFIQFIVQMIFFLHLSNSKKDRLKLYIFLSMAVIVMILVIGSVWIMNNLNARMMPSPNNVNKYIKSQDGL